MAMEQALEKAIRGAARKGVLSHSVIFSGDGDLEHAARFYAAALLCTAEDKPCLRCPACGKVLRDTHPDVITARDEEHKDLSVAAVRQLRTDAFIRPNEGAAKVFIFPDSRRLTEQDQNLLLKLVEEGPAYAAFLFCADNVSRLLPTVRSRCVEYTVRASDTALQLSDEAAALCRVLSGGDGTEAARVLTGLENRKITREALGRALLQCRQAAQQALRLQYGVQPDEEYAEYAGRLSRRLDRKKLMRLIDGLDDYGHQCEWNVGVGHVLGAVLAQWEEIL